MANTIDIKLTGDMMEGLNRLAEAANEPVLRATCFAGALVFLEEAKRRVPVKTGTIKKNLIIKRLTEKAIKGQSESYIVTVRKGKNGNEGDAYYAPWVEDGHKVVGKKGKGSTWKAHRKAMETEYGTSKVGAKPFIRPAWDAVKQEAIDAMRAKMGEKIKGFLEGKA
jgi:HK97 gp10 family phage protein